MLEPRIILLTGERQIGKSTVCLGLVDMLRQTDLKVSGLITRRSGPDDLQVDELHTGDTYALTLQNTEDIGLTVGHFRMSVQALARGDRALDSAFPTQVFILDEVGRLELERGQGWARALKLLHHKSYRIAFIVVRPELLIHAMHHLPSTFYTIVTVTADTRDTLPAALFNATTDACFANDYELTIT